MKKLFLALLLAVTPAAAQVPYLHTEIHATADAAILNLQNNSFGAIAVFPAYAERTGAGAFTALSWVSIYAPSDAGSCDPELGSGTVSPISCYPSSGRREPKLKKFEMFSEAALFIATLPERKTAFMVRRPQTTMWYVVYEGCVGFFLDFP